MAVFYPLAVGNSWTYKTKDNVTFINSVTALKAGVYSVTCNMADRIVFMKKEGDAYLADTYEAGNFQQVIGDGLKKGDSWEIRYRANNIDDLLAMAVKETGITKEVHGIAYNDVLMVEGDLKMVISGNMIPANYQVQHYYAAGIGHVLTTSSYGDHMGLVGHVLK
jgi:hypothetical protein